MEPAESKRRAPWWLHVVAASYLAFYCLHTYASLRGVEPSAFNPVYSGNEMRVQAVEPGGPVARAGVQPGDRIVAVNGQPMRNVLDWYAARANFEVGKPIEYTLERDRQTRRATVTLARKAPFAEDGGLFLFFLVTRSGMIILALVIAFRRAHDGPSVIGAWLLGTMALADIAPSAGSAAMIRNVPLVLQGLVWISGLGQFVFPGILLTFCCIFPRPLLRARWVWLAVWTPQVLLGLSFVGYGLQMTYRPGQELWGTNRLLAVMAPTTGVYVLASLAALWMNYRRLVDANERRRVRVLVAGMILGWLGGLPFILFVYWQPAAPYSRAFLDSPLSSLSVLLFLAFPFAFAYAVLRHRVFDLGAMLRIGLQYALARQVLLSVAPVCGGLFLLDLFLHADQPLVNILQARGWIYLALGAAAMAVQWNREKWIAALDRSFFRERYDAQRLLRDVAQEVRGARRLEPVAPRVAAQIEAALHPEFAAVMTRSPGEPQFRPVAVAPPGAPPPLIPAESKLLGLLRVLGKPLELGRSDSSWLQQQLPPEETDFLRRARMELLIPVATAPAGGAEALLVLGLKRSEEPYSREDLDLLAAIASSLALVLERPAESPAPARTGSAFEECPQCGACYDSGAGRCAQEGVLLTPVRLPRNLSGRYRLERRVGRGGMGAVYKALDTSLKRAVAVKLIRDDLLGNAEAARRFEREAQAAASFTHPNVVTVHDFGIAADTRAFLVMELLRGVSLRDEMRAHRQIPAARTVGILRGVCAALEAAHRQQLIHRDLKPENVFLARDGATETTKVLDFGLAKALPLDPQATADTDPAALVGTLHYMSPEQLNGRPADVSWDLWALAMISYEMLAGSKPFSGDTAGAWQSAVLAGRATPITVHLPQAGPPLMDFFTRALATDPRQRFASASGFHSALETAAS
jgi:tRNA A-37 threonylcarbamoyl transferase component Bud32